MPKTQAEFYLNITVRECCWEEDIASHRVEKRRNIWKISVLQSLPETAITSKRVTSCTTWKSQLTARTVPLLHPAAGAAQVCPPFSNLRHGRDKRIILNPEKCFLTSQKQPCLSWRKDILGAHHHHLSLPSPTAAQMSPFHPPPPALQDLIRTAHCTGEIAPGHL